MAVAAFDYDAWAVLFPEFDGKVTEASATALFGQAGLLYLNNTDCSPVADVAVRQQYLYLLTAHLAALGGALTGGATAGLVGSISEAAEGSVKISLNKVAVPGSAAWYAQTQYGLAYWAATAAYRTAQYVPGPVHVIEPWPWGLGYGGVAGWLR